jgi:hypothetical protein
VGLTSTQRAKRNAQVVRDRLEAELPWEEIAKRNGINARHCREVVRSWLGEAGPTADEDPIKVVDDLLRGYSTDLWELTEAANAAWDERNVAAVIAAVRSRMEVRNKAVELLQATGRLPKDLGRLRVEVDVRWLTEVILEIFARHQVPAAARRELMEALRPSQPESNGHAVAEQEEE